MIIVRNVAATALALCSFISDAFHRASPALVSSIAEQGQLGNAGYAALLTLHVTSASVMMPGSSRTTLNSASPANVTALYTICLAYDSTMANITQPSHCLDPPSTAPTVLPYSGTKALALYDNRRDVTIYDRGPQGLTVYAAPIDCVQLWVDTRPHKIAFLSSLPSFQDDIRLFKAYRERRVVLLAIVKAVEDPIELGLRRDHCFPASTAAHPPCMFVVPQQAKPMAISQKLVLLHAIWLLVVLGCIVYPDGTRVCGSSDPKCDTDRPVGPCTGCQPNPTDRAFGGKMNKNQRKNLNRRNRMKGIVSIG